MPSLHNSNQKGRNEGTSTNHEIGRDAEEERRRSN